MKPEQFIREQGLPEVNRILEEAPKHSKFVIPCLDGEMYFSQREDDGKWFKWSNGYSKWLEYFGKCNPLDLAYSLSDLKRLVESVEIINQAGGYEVVKTAISNYRASGDMVTFSSLEKRLKDHESIYGGSHES